MGIPAGTHTFGPENGALWVKTGRAGAAAQAGHDLLIQVTSWRATLEIDEDPSQTSIVLEADASSLRVQDGFGGMQPLGDDDKASIEQTIDDEVLKRMDIEFRSTAVQPADGGKMAVQGELTLGDAVHPLELEVEVGDDGRLSGSAVIKQTDWGITPYSALFGALKVADEVAVAVDASWRNAGVGRVAPAPDWSDVFEIEWRPVPVVDPGISSFVWALVFFLYLWFGMAAVGVSFGTALVFSLVLAFFLFLYFRTKGMGRQEDEGQSR
jgi:polyisoprenoid-binding protein YceI